MGMHRPSLIGGGGGGVAFVQATAFGANAGGTTIPAAAFSSDVTSGNLLVAFACYNSGTQTISSITDTGSNTWNSVAAAFTGGSSNYSQMWIAENVTGGSSFVVTANLTGSAGFRKIVVMEISGAALSGAADQYTTGTGLTGTAQSIGPVTPTTNGQMLIGAIWNVGTSGHTFSAAGSWTEPAGSTADPANYEACMIYQIQATAASVSAEFTKSASSTSQGAIVTLKAA